MDQPDLIRSGPRRAGLSGPPMESDMDLTKKTTILLSPDLHAHLTQTARARRTSLGQLVRDACETQYCHVSSDDRVRAVEGLRRLSLPIGSPRKMKQESVQPIRRERSWTITAV